MTRYAPPGARVADVVSDAVARPRVIAVALSLLLMSLTVSAVQIGLLTELSGELWLVGGLAVFALGYLTLVLCAWRRHRWARIALVVVVAVGVLGNLIPLPDDPGPEPLSAIDDWRIDALGWLVSLLELAAVGLLFTRSARQWYAAERD